MSHVATAGRLPSWALNPEPLDIIVSQVVGAREDLRGPQVVSIADGRIAKITPAADALRAASGVRRLDRRDCVLGPGFVDAHVHSTNTGLLINGLDLRGMESREAVLTALARACDDSRNAIQLGHGWDETTWQDPTPPTREELDRAAAGAMVYLSRVDVHSAVASTALRQEVPRLDQLAGFSLDGPLSQQAHGAVREAAMTGAGVRQRAGAQRAFRAAAAALGIVAAHEMAGPIISSVEDLHDVLALSRDEPGPDISGYWGQLAEEGGIAVALEVGALGVGGDLFIDGAIGSRTACLREAYADMPMASGSGTHGAHGAYGAQYLDADTIARHVVAATRAGVQAGFHVIGDGAADALCAGLQSAQEQCGIEAIRSLKHRVEHIEMLDARQVQQLADWNVTASVQPMFDGLWGGSTGMYAERLGVARAARLNPFGSMAAAGVRLAFGSDSPVTRLGPWSAIQAAVEHHQPAERIRPGLALQAHTVHGWSAVGVRAGMVAEGEPAHLALWHVPAGDTIGADAHVARLARMAPACVLTLVHGVVVHGEAA